jgi:hypothetical protein
MDVFSTELGIQLSFVKTSEFRGGGDGFEPPPTPPPQYATGCHAIINYFGQPILKM